MTIADTNMIIRFLVRDDEKQAKLVYRRLRKAESDRTQIFISLAVVLETIWVLESAHDKTRREILEAIGDMRQMPVFIFEKDEVVERLINDGQRFNKADLSDILIAHTAQASGCSKGDTFDKGAATLPFFDILK